ncbi:hypothetical protein GPECTOR_120g423 [Gonium pectorale]|uniref:Uncharacterized protein n=1 Tax=Gonium pectorale TaxID=33097 RepID=A0A150FYQ6_GONPE|nr:hypothetical protein GPECTOR_120g423 [Gonium pectorale]|eukprot:KXZ42756.1 hypothetical protein GPECTOR_120g423 [Gonium pectorale]
MMLTAIFTRKKTPVQVAVFMIAASITFVSERLNKLGAEHWKRFATQNYFDPSGVFMSAVVSGPLLLVLFIVLVNYLRNCVALLVEAKKKELIWRAKQRAKEAKKEASGKGGATDKKED